MRKISILLLCAALFPFFFYKFVSVPGLPETPGYNVLYLSAVGGYTLRWRASEEKFIEATLKLSEFMAIERGIFSSARKAWIAVASYTVFLYATLTIAYDIFMFYSNQIGPDSVSSRMNLAFVPVGVILLLFIIFSLPRVWGVYLSFTLICLGVVFSLQILTLPAKRFHFFQYAPLTILVFDALRFTIKGRFLYIWTLTLVALIGLGDESIQWMLPNRYFGIVDLVVNTAAGLFTLAFIGFVLGEENYPWGPQRSKDVTDRH